MFILIILFTFWGNSNPIKLYREGKYREFIKAFYSEPKFGSEKYFPYVALSYLNLGELDSAWAYYKRIPGEKPEFRALDGLSYRIAEELRKKGLIKEALEAYYYSYLGKYNPEECVKYICFLSGIPKELATDSTLKFLFAKNKIYLVAPFSGEYSDIGEELYNSISFYFEGSIIRLDEEDREKLSKIPENSIVIGPIKKSTSRYLDSLYKFPILWISPFTENIPMKSVLFYSPYKTLMEECDFLVSFILDTLHVSKVALVRDTSYLEELFASYFKTSMAKRGKFLSYDICVTGPMEFDSTIAMEVDSQNIEVAVISGLSKNSYFLYSAFRTMFPGKPIVGTFAWLSKMEQIPKYMLDLIVSGVPITIGQILRNSEIREKFTKEYGYKFGYFPSEVGLTGLDISLLLNEVSDTNNIGTLLNLMRLSGYVGPSGAVYKFSGGFLIYEIVKGELIKREEQDGREEN